MSRIECSGGFARRNRGFSFDNYGRMSAIGENAILEGRWSVAGPGTLCASNASIDVGLGTTSYWIPTSSTFISTTLGVNVYVPLTAAPGTYSIPQIVIRQGQYSKDAWAYITKGDTFTVPERVTSCSISHPSSLTLSPNIAQSSEINWSCTGPEPSSMKIEMAIISGLSTSDGTGMALVPTGGVATVNGKGIIVRGTTKTGTAASCTASADNNTIYWNVSGKGGVLPVSYSNKKTLLSWIACGTSATEPGKYQGSATLKFIYK